MGQVWPLTRVVPQVALCVPVQVHLRGSEQALVLANAHVQVQV